MIGFHIGCLIRDQRIGRRVGFVEAVTGELVDYVKDIVSEFLWHALRHSPLDEYLSLHVHLGLDFLTHRPAQQIRVAKRVAGQDLSNLHHLFLIDWNTKSFLKHRLKGWMQIVGFFFAVLTSNVARNVYYMPNSKVRLMSTQTFLARHPDETIQFDSDGATVSGDPNVPNYGPLFAPKNVASGLVVSMGSKTVTRKTINSISVYPKSSPLASVPAVARETAKPNVPSKPSRNPPGIDVSGPTKWFDKDDFHRLPPEWKRYCSHKRYEAYQKKKKADGKDSDEKKGTGKNNNRNRNKRTNKYIKEVIAKQSAELEAKFEQKLATVSSVSSANSSHGVSFISSV